MPDSRTATYSRERIGNDNGWSELTALGSGSGSRLRPGGRRRWAINSLPTKLDLRSNKRDDLPLNIPLFPHLNRTKRRAPEDESVGPECPDEEEEPGGLIHRKMGSAKRRCHQSVSTDARLPREENSQLKRPHNKERDGPQSFSRCNSVDRFSKPPSISKPLIPPPPSAAEDYLVEADYRQPISAAVKSSKEAFLRFTLESADIHCAHVFFQRYAHCIQSTDKAKQREAYRRALEFGLHFPFMDGDTSLLEPSEQEQSSLQYSAVAPSRATGSTEYCHLSPEVLKRHSKLLEHVEFQEWAKAQQPVPPSHRGGDYLTSRSIHPSPVDGHTIGRMPMTSRSIYPEVDGQTSGRMPMTSRSIYPEPDGQNPGRTPLVRGHMKRHISAAVQHSAAGTGIGKNAGLLPAFEDVNDVKGLPRRLSVNNYSDYARAEPSMGLQRLGIDDYGAYETSTQQHSPSGFTNNGLPNGMTLDPHYRPPPLTRQPMAYGQSYRPDRQWALRGGKQYVNGRPDSSLQASSTRPSTLESCRGHDGLIHRVEPHMPMHAHAINYYEEDELRPPTHAAARRYGPALMHRSNGQGRGMGYGHMRLREDAYWPNSFGHWGHHPGPMAYGGTQYDETGRRRDDAGHDIRHTGSMVSSINDRTIAKSVDMSEAPIEWEQQTDVQTGRFRRHQSSNFPFLDISGGLSRSGGLGRSGHLTDRTHLIVPHSHHGQG